MVEVYCERVRDLLEPPGSCKGDNLPIKHDPERGMFVEGGCLGVHVARDSSSSIIDIHLAHMAVRLMFRAVQ